MKSSNTFVLFLCCLSILSCKNSKIEEKNSELDKVLNFYQEKGLFNGSVLIIDKDLDIVWNKSVGFDGKNHTSLLTSHSQFPLGNLSNQFTAMAIMILQQQGKLVYDRPVKDYLNEFKNESITIRNLLNHTSGILEYDHYLQNASTSSTIVSSALVGEGFSPNGQFYLSNTNYYLLALIIEKVSAKKYSDFIDQYIFQPLGMHNSYVVNLKGSINFQNKVYGYKLEEGDTINLENKTIKDVNINSRYNIYSTSEDFSKWLVALSDYKLIKREEFKQAYERPVLANGKKEYYGFGWHIPIFPKNKSLSMADSSIFGGFSHSVSINPKTGSAILILSNNSSKHIPELRRALAMISYGFEYALPKSQDL